MTEQQIADLAERVAAIVVERLRSSTIVPEAQAPDTMQFGPLVVDFRALCATLHGEPLDLPRREFATLAYLARNAGTAITRERLLSNVWPDQGDDVEMRTVDVHIRRVRQRIGDDDAHLIKTIHGIGYRIDPVPV